MDVRAVITSTTASARDRAEALAQRLGLPRMTDPPPDPAIPVLSVSDSGLTLSLGAAGPAIRVDFGRGPAGWRSRHASIAREPLARACGLAGGERPRIIDTTAGLGSDSFVLATLGCPVEACERDPVVAELLADGLERARAAPSTAAAAERIRLHRIDARSTGDSVEAPWPVALLDPMFPARRKSAAVGKEMRIVQALLGETADADAAELLAYALERARVRVVVKRPLRAPAIAGPAPSGSIRGRAVRFDIYAGRG